jgi:hypothetical protein
MKARPSRLSRNRGRTISCSSLTLPLLGLEHGNVHCGLPDPSMGSHLGLPYTVRSLISGSSKPVDATQRLMAGISPAAVSLIGQCGRKSSATRVHDVTLQSSLSFFSGTIEQPSAPQRLRAQDKRHKVDPSSSEYRLHVLAGRPLRRL